MKQFSGVRNLIGIIFCGLILSGCSLSAGTAYGPTVANFAVSLKLVTEAVTDSFSFVEQEHSQSQSDQVALQYALDGTPTVKYSSLFSTEDIKARTAVVDGLKAYADKLLSTVSGKELTAVTAYVKSAAVNLSRASMGKFDLSHSLTEASSKKIETAKNGFATMLIEPVQSLRIAKLVKKAEPDFHKLVVLLYADIGSSADQVSNCQFEIPSQPESLNLHSVNLCEGGLRSIAQLVYGDDIGTLKAHISVVTKKSPTDTTAKSALVTELLSRQTAARNLDAYLAELQKALVLMNDAHSNLGQLFLSKKKLLTIDFDSFTQAAEKLSSLAPNSGNVPDTGAGATTQAPLDQSGAAQSVSDDDINEKIRSLRTALNKLDQLLDKDLPLDQLKSALISRSKLSEQIEMIDLAQIEQRDSVFNQTVTDLASIKNELEKIKAWIQKAKAAATWATAIVRSIAAVIAFI